MLSEKPWKLDVVVRLLFRIAICILSIWFVLGLVLQLKGGAKPDENSHLLRIIQTLSMQGSILLMVAVTLRQEHICWGEAFGFKKTGLAYALLLGVLIAITFLPVGL